jgi:hypothetical protein
MMMLILSKTFIQNVHLAAVGACIQLGSDPDCSQLNPLMRSNVVNGLLQQVWGFLCVGQATAVPGHFEGGLTALRGLFCGFWAFAGCACADLSSRGGGCVVFS